MSHTITVTRTTTTTSTPALLLNIGPFRTVPGLLKLAQILIGAICVGLVAHYWTNYSLFASATHEIFFLIVSSAFLITTTILFCSMLVSITTATILPKSIFELIYHFVAFILYLAASIHLIIHVQHSYKSKYYYEEALAAAILGFVNTALYLFSTVLAHKSYKGT